MSTSPLISIITATYNAGPLLERTINSVLNQTYPSIEYIIIDGASKDNTLAIIEKYKQSIKYTVSEPDAGIYDAWNKGVKAATGDWLAFLGAGDEYLPDAISNYLNYITASTEPNLEFVSSKVDIVNDEGVSLYYIGSEWNWKKFTGYMNVAHVGSLHSKRLFDKYGIYNTNYKIVGDYELLLRPGPNLKAGFLPQITAKMLFGGMSVSKKGIKEVYKVKCASPYFSPALEYLKYKSSLFKATVRFFLYRMGIHISIRK